MKSPKKSGKNFPQVFVFYNVGRPEIRVAFPLALGIGAPAKQSQICEGRTNLGWAAVDGEVRKARPWLGMEFYGMSNRGNALNILNVQKFVFGVY